MKNKVLFDIPIKVVKQLNEDGLDALFEWLDDKYHLVHENGRYETASLVESYWNDYLSNSESKDQEKHWLDCAKKIKEYDIK